jgi:hypothetical protein
MKKLVLGVLMFVAACTAVVAQISSTDCIEDIKKVYVQIDHERLMSGADQMRIDFKHSYIMRFDEEAKTVSYDETMVFGPKFRWYDSPEFTECSDGSEAYNYRKHQMIVYRTASTLSKSGSLIPLVDKGLFAYCLVKECAFVTAPGQDTLRHKRALITVNDEGQKKYQVKELEFVWNPITSQPIVAAVTFTEKSIWKWAKWDFYKISKMEPALPGDVKTNLLDANGQLLGKFKGAEILDYR